MGWVLWPSLCVELTIYCRCCNKFSAVFLRICFSGVECKLSRKNKRFMMNKKKHRSSQMLALLHRDNNFKRVDVHKHRWCWTLWSPNRDDDAGQTIVMANRKIMLLAVIKLYRYQRNDFEHVFHELTATYHFYRFYYLIITVIKLTIKDDSGFFVNNNMPTCSIWFMGG